MKYFIPSLHATKKKRNIAKSYPLFAFRLSQLDKNCLMAHIEEVTNLLNKKIKEDEYRFTKSDIIINALEKSLKSLKARAQPLRLIVHIYLRR